MRRPTPRASTINKLKDYYGGKVCVITGHVDKEDHASIKWGHLNDGTASEEAFFPDLVPIDGWINDLQEDWRKANAHKPSRTVTRTNSFGAKSVWEAARVNFQRGQPARAYGAARYGLAMASQYPNQFRAEEGDDWAFACQALVYLPYRPQGELLIHLLQTIESLAESRDYIPACNKAALLLALANYYQDGGIWEEAQELMHAVKPQWGFRNTLASLYRRDALAGFFSGESRRVVDRLFEKSNELNNDQDFELSALIARAWILYSDGSASEALDVLEPFEGLTLSKLEKWSISLSPHNIFELMLIRATLKKALGKPYMKEVVCFNTLAETKPETLLRAVFTDQIGPHIIHDEFSQLYSRLQSNFLFSPELARILKSLGRKIIEKKESPSQGMNSWAD